MRVIIIDDEPLARSIVKEYLQHYPQVELVQECGDGFEGLKAIQQYKPDCIFLDIQMPKINGFEMLELVDEPPAIIFTTAFDEYAIKAFEAHAVDYLLKPFSKERFDKAIQKWMDQQNNHSATSNDPLLDEAARSPQQRNRIVVKTGNNIKIIPVQDITYLEAADDYVKIHTKEGVFLKNKTMGHFETQLEEAQFVRCHRSFIVNVQQVTRIEVHDKDNHIVVLRAGQSIPVSRNGYARLKKLLDM
jgi:two-component system LytT family response regulator